MKLNDFMNIKAAVTGKVERRSPKSVQMDTEIVFCASQPDALPSMGNTDRRYAVIHPAAPLRGTRPALVIMDDVLNNESNPVAYTGPGFDAAKVLADIMELYADMTRTSPLAVFGLTEADVEAYEAENSDGLPMAWVIERAGRVSMCHYENCAKKAAADGYTVTPYYSKGKK